MPDLRAPATGPFLAAWWVAPCRVLLGGWVVAGSALAADLAPPPVPPPEAAASASDAADTTDAALAATRATVRDTAEWLASGVDSWFGDKPFSEGGQVRDGRLSLGVFKRAHDSGEVNLRFNARFRLPNLEERYYLFVGRDNPRDLVTDQPGALTRQQDVPIDRERDQSFFAGLGVSLRDAVDFRLGFRGGLKPYTQLRYRHPWTWGDEHLLEFRQTAFWTVDDHLGSTTALSYEWRLTPLSALRWVNAATITQASHRWELASNLGLYQSFGKQRLLSLELLARTAQHTGVDVTDGGVQVKWEQPVHKDWLLGELLVGHYWPRPDASAERLSVWGLGGTLKLRF